MKQVEMRKVFSVAQIILALAFVVVIVRHQFFGWHSFTYVIASGGFIVGICAWLELSKLPKLS